MAKAQAGDVSNPVEIWWQYPSLAESKLFAEYVHRLTANRDLHVVITAASETGVGKTTLAVVLALLWDQHGWTADKSAVADAREYDALYDEVNPGSVLILDEAEKAVDSRRGSSKSNVELSQSFAAKRYKQVFGILTAPTKSWIDKRLGAHAADYWIQCQETDMGRPKGEAKVYRLRSNEHYGTDYHKRVEMIKWPNLDQHPQFQRLDQMKEDMFSGNLKSNYIHRDEVQDIKTNFWNKSQKKTGYDLVKAMLDDLGMSQQQIADIFSLAEISGFSQSQVSRINQCSQFDEWYYD